MPRRSASKKSTFHDFLHNKVHYYRSFLSEYNFLDEKSDGPKVGDLEAELQSYEDNPHTIPEEGLQGVLDLCQNAATSYEALGNLDAALAWYKVGRYKWRGGLSYESVREISDLNVSRRDDAARYQLPAAICSDRSGYSTRARNLYTWTAENRRLTAEEVDHYLGTKQESVIWQRLPYRAYALACLEEWQESADVCHVSLEIVGQDPDIQLEGWQESALRVLSMVRALCDYQLSPGPETRKLAIARLHPQFAATRVHVDHLDNLFYLYNLRARHPELAHPDPDELPPAERARQGYEACLAWMAHVDLPLDGTPESLKLLDQQLREMWNALNEEKRKTALFLWGSYVGEVVRQELAGGQWNFEPDNMLAWTLDWELGEVELHLHPYQHVRERARGENEQGLYQLWREIEESYVDFGLAAKYAD